MKIIKRSISEPIRPPMLWEDTWAGDDKGLIKAWETGRAAALSRPELAEKCRVGELPPIGWKGGVERKLKIRHKYGALNYLATWQGLRGEDLNINMDEETSLVCTRTGMLVVYTPCLSKLANGIALEDNEEDKNNGPTQGI